MKNPDYIQISLKPILIIGVILLTLISTGFIFDTVRSYSKLAKVKDHAQVILNANSSDIIKILRDPSEMEAYLKTINRPEKNIYQISFIRTLERPWILYGYHYSPMAIEHINTLSETKIGNVIDNDGIIESIKGQDILPKLASYGQKEFILVGLPVSEFGQNYGYLLVSVNKTTDLD